MSSLKKNRFRLPKLFKKKPNQTTHQITQPIENTTIENDLDEGNTIENDLDEQIKHENEQPVIENEQPDIENEQPVFEYKSNVDNETQSVKLIENEPDLEPIENVKYIIETNKKTNEKTDEKTDEETNEKTDEETNKCKLIVVELDKTNEQLRDKIKWLYLCLLVVFVLETFAVVCLFVKD